MISVILIGKNEGWRLTKSLDSVERMVMSYPDLDFEVLYIDSQSEDDSISRAKQFPRVRIFEITGKKNAAVARNIGAKESSGEILFFIDADMEIDANFLQHVIENGQLKHDCLTGHVDDYFYDENDRFINSQPRTYKNEISSSIEVLKTTGGLMLVTRAAWNRVKGMRTKYKRSQDLDFCLRLNEIGILVYRHPYFLAKHHTVSYVHQYRMWKNLQEGYQFFPAMLFRDHIQDVGNIKRTLRGHYSDFMFLTVFICFVLNVGFFPYSLAAYFIFIGGWLLAKNHKDKNAGVSLTLSYLVQRYIYQILGNGLFWIGFFCFFPKAKKIEYKVVE